MQALGGGFVHDFQCGSPVLEPWVPGPDKLAKHRRLSQYRWDLENFVGRNPSGYKLSAKTRMTWRTETTSFTLVPHRPPLFSLLRKQSRRDRRVLHLDRRGPNRTAR